MWWSKPKSLPEPTGPFVPGMTDVMIGYEKDGLFFRLYYPTDAKKDDPENEKRYYPWVPDDTYVEGFGNVVRHKLFIRFAFWWSNTNIIPALYEAKPRKNSEKLKCIIMSHGLGGTRFAYSNICCELASYGFLVIAIEHRDQSACCTYYYKNKEDAEQNLRTIIPYIYMELGLDDEHRKRRNTQVHFRAEECCKVIDILKDLNDGKIIPENILDNVPLAGTTNLDFKLNDLIGHLDINNIGIIGHSFGGATSLLTFKKHPELKYAILLDAWMFSVENENLEHTVEHPLLFINTENFYFEANVRVIKEFLNKDKDNRKIYTIFHTLHENQSDSPLLIGYRPNSWFMKKLDPLTALRINNSLILDFLNVHIDTMPCDIKYCKELLEEEKHNFENGLGKWTWN